MFRFPWMSYYWKFFIQKTSIMGAYKKVLHLPLTRINTLFILYNTNVAFTHEVVKW